MTATATSHTGAAGPAATYGDAPDSNGAGSTRRLPATTHQDLPDTRTTCSTPHLEEGASR